ncbi:hypothetical protein FACS1894105_01950 [Clostridia bacterium]|nr:hypothetical protein FACS1894105_01950 [Clostridia bacterium]
MSDVSEGIARGLLEAAEWSKGNLKCRTMKISVAPVPVYTAEEIKRIRSDLKMTQYLFAGFMGVSPKTVEAWESGHNVPTGPARRILSMVQSDPQIPVKFRIVSE